MRTPAAAVAAARRQRVCRQGRCLSYVVGWLQLPHKGYSDANVAYQKTKAAGHLKTTGTPPPGALVFIQGSRHGHIMLSVGGGKARSTDYPLPGIVSEVKITTLASRWRRRYAGWSVYYGSTKMPGH